MSQSPRILIAEDDPLNAMAIHAQLEAMGFTVVGVVSNGKEAVERAAARDFDLALLDVRMPRMSGLEAARRLFIDYGIPSVMLSGLHDEQTVELAWSIPVFHYLVKPIPMEELGAAIHVAWRRFQERSNPSAADRPGSAG